MDANEKGDEGERFVNEIAYHSFLKYWCYPGPLDILKDNKEICDLLIVFDTACIIVSVKNYAFTGDYIPYFNKTVRKALSQVAGAERKLFGKRDILLSHPDRKAELFRKENFKNVFRVIVNLNGATKFYEPSLYINNVTHVNVFDGDAWLGLVSEFNTVPDLVNYLKARDRLFNGNNCVMLPREENDFGPGDRKQFLKFTKAVYCDQPFSMISGSELDLIATYIQGVHSFPPKLIENELPAFVMNIDGAWDRYLKSKLATDKTKFEYDAYIVDYFVKEYLIHQPNGDKISKTLYRMDRFQRARFSKELFSFYEAQRTKKPAVGLHRSNVLFDDFHFVFIYFDPSFEQVNEEVLSGFMDKSMAYHDYLFNYQCQEVVSIAFSSDVQSFAFGYYSHVIYSKDEMKSMEETFRAMEWPDRISVKLPKP